MLQYYPIDRMSFEELFVHEYFKSQKSEAKPQQSQKGSKFKSLYTASSMVVSETNVEINIMSDKIEFSKLII